MVVPSLHQMLVISELEFFEKCFKKIVTAAHCIKSTNPKSWKIGAGHLTRSDRGAQIRNVVRLYKHPKYNSRNNDNDVTVMIVRRGS